MLGASLVIFPNQCSPGEAISNPSENRINFNSLPLESANNLNNHRQVFVTRMVSDANIATDNSSHLPDGNSVQKNRESHLVGKLLESCT